MFKHSLICTDFTDGLHRLVEFVPDLAQSGLQQLTFFHSVPLWEEGDVPRVNQEQEEAARAKLSKALENVPQGVKVNIEVISGKPVDTIPRVLKKDDTIDLIITGTPIHSLLKEKFIGSTSKGVARLTPVPLMIFRPQLITIYTKEELALRCQHLSRYLLIPYNDSPAAHYLIEQIKEYASSRPANSLQQCLLMWVIDDSSRRERELAPYRQEEAEKKLAAVKTELEALDLQVETLIKFGSPLPEIMAAALDYDISAIAVATDYRNNLLEFTIPSVAEDIMCRSWFPVLFFSPKK